MLYIHRFPPSSILNFSSHSLFFSPSHPPPRRQDQSPAGGQRSLGLHQRQPRGGPRGQGHLLLHRLPGTPPQHHRGLLAHGVGAEGGHHRHGDPGCRKWKGNYL